MKTPFTPEELQAMQKAVDDASPGPWEMGTFAKGVLIVSQTRTKHDPLAFIYGTPEVPWDATEDSKQMFDDANFITHFNPEVAQRIMKELKLLNELRDIFAGAGTHTESNSQFGRQELIRMAAAAFAKLAV